MAPLDSNLSVAYSQNVSNSTLPLEDQMAPAVAPLDPQLSFLAGSFGKQRKPLSQRLLEANLCCVDQGVPSGHFLVAVTGVI